MQNTKALFEQLYAAFNRRDIEATLTFMSDDIDWPKASEGGRVTGKAGIRDYWTRQWQEFVPHVSPMEVTEREPGKNAVRVHQHVTSLNGEVLFDGIIWHVYTLADGVVTRMDIEEAAPWPAAQPPQMAETH